MLAVLFVSALVQCSRSGFESTMLRTWLLEPTWGELGGSATGGGVTSRGGTVCCQRIGVDRQGVPYLLWSEQHDGTWNIYLVRWDGGAWVSLAGSNDPGGLSQLASGYSVTGDVVFDTANQPIAVWSHDTPGGRVVYGRRFDGSSWQELGGSASGGGISGFTTAWWPKASVDAAGHLLVAWEAWNGVAVPGTIFLRRWDGSQWSGLGGSDAGVGVSSPLDRACVVDIDTDGSQVTLSWQANDVSGIGNVYLRQWNGSSWQGLGGSDADAGISSTATPSVSSSLARSADAPTLVWQEEAVDGPDIRLLQWRQGAWQPLGDSASLRQQGLMSDDPRHPVVASTSDGVLVVVWVQGPANAADIHAVAWVDGAWYPIGAAPGSTNVSETLTHSDWPALAPGPDGEVYIAWAETVATGTSEIYAKVRR